MKVGLVLGAGGVLGGAWITGGLHALTRETGWDPGSADRIVGTSAGSVMGALVASGVPPWFMVAHSRGEGFEGLKGPDGRPTAEADRDGGAVFRLHRGLPPIGPGSPRLVLRTLRNPRRHTPLALAVGWLPRGVISTSSLKAIIGRAVPGEGWVDHPSYWAVAYDYEAGHRVAFGREDAPDASIGDAVAASCAIPGFYHPVTIAGRRYVDGGVRSPSNLDLLADSGLDLVICLNPTSTRAKDGSRNPIARAWRKASGRRLGAEAKRVRAGGTEVVLIQPTLDDLLVMGDNLMTGRRRNEVIASAECTVGEQLRAAGVRELVRDLPAGEPHKLAMPGGDPVDWPAIGAAVRRAA